MQHRTYPSIARAAMNNTVIGVVVPGWSAKARMPREPLRQEHQAAAGGAIAPGGPSMRRNPARINGLWVRPEPARYAQRASRWRRGFEPGFRTGSIAVNGRVDLHEIG